MRKSATVSEAIETRKSVRAFTEQPVASATIMTLLEKASRAPSGGNLQPWHVAVINDEAMVRFKALMKERLGNHPMKGGETAQYRVYPAALKEPYRTRRYEIGEIMYRALGIARDDREARLRRFARNFQFFGAPAALFCFIDRTMGPPQWSDLGMFLQSFMLLAREAGLDTCPQECWSAYPQTVAQFCGMDEDLMLFCGVAIGYRDDEAPVNKFDSPRAPLSQWVKTI